MCADEVSLRTWALGSSRCSLGCILSLVLSVRSFPASGLSVNSTPIPRPQDSSRSFPGVPCSETSSVSFPGHRLWTETPTQTNLHEDTDVVTTLRQIPSPGTLFKPSNQASKFNFLPQILRIRQLIQSNLRPEPCLPFSFPPGPLITGCPPSEAPTRPVSVPRLCSYECLHLH